MAQKSVSRRANSSFFEKTTNSFFSQNAIGRKSITMKQETPLTDEEIQSITKRALKDLKNQRKPNIQIVDCIKGKPYCLRLGEKDCTTDNFKTFYNKFYSTIYGDKLRIKKQNKVETVNKENITISRATSKIVQKPKQRPTLRSKFIRNLSNIIDSCNQVIKTDPDNKYSSHQMSEIRSKRLF